MSGKFLGQVGSSYRLIGRDIKCKQVGFSQFREKSHILHDYAVIAKVAFMCVQVSIDVWPMFHLGVAKVLLMYSI